MIDVVYARAVDGTHIAYRVLGADPSATPARDLVMVSGGLFPMELFEEDPGFARLLEGLRSLGRVIVFDRRGVGQSDPITNWEQTVADQWTQDLAAVVDAAVGGLPAESKHAATLCKDGVKALLRTGSPV